MKNFLLCATLLLCWSAIRSAEGVAEPLPVTLVETADTVTLSNLVLSATLKKSSGNISSLQFHDIETLGHGGGYWNVYGNTPGQPFTQEKGARSTVTVTQDPAKNGGTIGEVEFAFTYAGDIKNVPLDIKLRYTLKRGDSGIYAWAILEHKSTYPAFNIGVGTLCLKLNPNVFDFLSIDKDRQRLMPTSEDWVNGTRLNVQEARRIHTGIHKGEVEHKYDYNALFSRTPAWGWSSTTRHVGIFMVNPALEFINGGPVGVDYGGHIDVKPTLPADPTLLFVWHTPHYGGRPISLREGEVWNKTIGPFLIDCASAETPEKMWKEALHRAELESRAWPYQWADSPDYERAEKRGSASGVLVLKDSEAPAQKMAGAWIGLAHAPYSIDFKKPGDTTIDWQTDGKFYQYWAKFDPAGSFTIANVQPGTYELYAFSDGVLGTFHREKIQITAGAVTKLGELLWIPERFGKQLWEIGVPNRSAEEFRHGDHFWEWGLYNLYPTEFPNDVDFTIGKSDYRRDWNYAQPPKLNGKDAAGKEQYGDSTWRIRFDMPEASKGTATLRLAICGARGGPVDVALNGAPIGSSGELPESGVMHRDGIRSAPLTERNIKFDAAQLKPGANVIELTKRARAWTDGVLYDYLRLELDSEKPFAP